MSTTEDRSRPGPAQTTLAGGSSVIATHSLFEEALERGSTLGRYTVLDRVGAGGMGVVYTAYDPQLDRRVALKVLHPSADLELGSSSGRARLLREAQAMAKLSHPHVITVHDVGTFGDRVFVAMEFVEGGTLRAWLEQGGHDWSEIVDVFVRAGRGLAAAHAAGIVHRDFKPDNVLIGRDGRVLVMDFGLARPAAAIVEARARDQPDPEAPATDFALTRTGALLGTPAYMAPEQHRGAGADPLADQFSFCITLYEGLYGERPFPGTNVASLAMSVLEGRIRDPPRGTRVPPWLRQVVLRGLSVDPQDRFPSMDALLAELQRDPQESRTPWLGAAVAVGVAAIIIAAYLLSRPAPEERCPDATARIGETWNAAEQERLRSAVQAGGSASAPLLATAAIDRVEGWARTWADVHARSCDPRRVPGSRKIEPNDLPALACLEHARHRLAALLAVVPQLGPEDPARLVLAAGRLPDPHACEVEAIAAVASLASDPADSDARGAIEARLAEAAALVEIGREAEGKELARLALRDARPLDDSALMAEAHVVIGGADARAGDIDEAERALREAVLAAAAAARPDLEAQAWIALVASVGPLPGRLEEGDRLSLAARSAVVRAGDPLALQARLALSDGRRELARGQWEAARASLGKAARIHEDLGGGDDLDLVTTRMGAGLADEAAGRADEAREEHTQALATLERVLGPQDRRVGQALARLGTTELAVDDLARADASLARARFVLEPDAGRLPERPVDRVSLADALDRHGLLRRAQERFEDAEALHRRALALLESTPSVDERALGYPLVNLALALADRGHHDEAIAPLERARAIWQRTLPPMHPDLAVVEVDLGRSRFVQGDFEGARMAYAVALDIWEHSLPPDHPLLGYALTGLGRSALGLGDVASSVEHLERALTIRDHEDEDRLNLAEVCLALGRARWLEGIDRERARKLAVRARDLVGAYEPADEEGIDRMLEGDVVPRLTDQVLPAGLGTTRRWLDDE